MTTSILDVEELKKHISGVKDVSVVLLPAKAGLKKPVSGQDLIDRVKELFTPEEAEALARRIEEGREQAND